jgi:predicted nucleic acid-binding protein
MIVIADTGPINYLISIGHVGVLPKLYSTVLIPCAVRDELRDARAPDIVRQWIQSPPEWLEIRSPATQPDAELIAADLDAGESDAILLAQETGADEIILDDQLGRREAERRKLRTVGTLGVLRDASAEGLLDLREALARLQKTNFYLTQELIDRLLAEAGSTTGGG